MTNGQSNQGDSEDKPKRGGKREGAGRPTKGTTSKVKVSLYLDSEVVKTIRSQPNQAEFIEALVTAYSKGK